MSNLTPKDIASKDCGYWVKLKRIILPNGPFEFKNHEYLVEPLSSDARVEVEQKATQGGFSIKETLITLHGCIFNRYLNGVAFAMPSNVDVRKYSKTKFAPLISLNPISIGKYVKTGGKNTDAAELKKVGNSFVHFIGTTLSRNIEGEKESATLHSFSCDKFICDELDMMDLSVIEKLRGRFGHSTLKQERFISNPTAENYGINALFRDSDQRYWHRLCPACDKYTSPVLEFLRSPEGIIKQNKDGKGIIICTHCGGTLPLYYKKNDERYSKWIAQYRDKPVVGRLWSQLDSSFHDPYDILQAYYEPPEGNFKDVMKYRLGFAYTAKEEQLRKSQIYECCSREPMPNYHEGPCAMGVDVGIKKHVVIGCRTGQDRYEIIKIAIVAKWLDIHDLAKKYHVKLAGIDIAPDIDAAKDFQDAEQYQVWLCDYKVSRHITTATRDEKNKIIKANRTEAFDMTHRLINEKKLLFPRQEQIGEFAAQVCNPFKQEIKNERTGIPEYRYVGKNDHFRHALNYFALAVKYGRIAEVRGSYSYANQQEDVISEYVRV